MTNLPTSFSIDSSNKMFYNAKDICSHNPELFKGIKTKRREIIERNKIPSTEYVYACFNLKLNCWNISDKECGKAQLLISKEWVDTNMFNIRSEPLSVPIVVPSPIVAPIAIVAPLPIPVPIVVPSPIVVPDITGKKNTKKKFVYVESKEEDQEDHAIIKIENAPPILELEPHEKFHDTDGEILEIETRGRRHVDEIFFRVRDVMKRFDMPKLNDTLIRDDKDGYKVELHYKRFTRSAPGGSDKSKTKKPVKSLFLTYHGLLRVLFVSKNKNAEKFSRWAMTKLFTMQMGTKEDKEDLVREIVNNLESFKTVLKKYPQGFSGIYLLKLGRVEDLRETFEISETIDNDSLLCKFGFSRDLSRRLDEHKSDYGKLKNVNMNVETFHYIDPLYNQKAEAEIRNIFEAYDMRLMVPGRNELVVLNKKQLERIIKDYARTGNDYAGATQEMQVETAKLKQEIQDLMNEMKHKELEYKIAIMKETKEKERLQTLVETNERIHALEKNNYELQLQLLQK